MTNDLDRKAHTEGKEWADFWLADRGFAIYAFCVVAATLNLEWLGTVKPRRHQPRRMRSAARCRRHGSTLSPLATSQRIGEVTAGVGRSLVCVSAAKTV